MSATVHRIAVKGSMACAVRPSMIVYGWGGVGVWWRWWMIGEKTEGERGAWGVPLLNGVCSGVVVVAPGWGWGDPRGPGVATTRRRY